MTDPVRLRPATAADVPALAALYADCARALGPQVYTPEQVAAWARFADDLDGFAAYVLGAETWVAELSDMPDRPDAPDDHDRQPLGFCGADDHGEVRSLYVRPGHGRRGLATRLLAHVLARCRERGLVRQQAWVTPLSRPVFERAGFRLIATVQAPYQGVMFERYRVERVERVERVAGIDPPAAPAS